MDFYKVLKPIKGLEGYSLMCNLFVIVRYWRRFGLLDLACLRYNLKLDRVF